MTPSLRRIKHELRYGIGYVPQEYVREKVWLARNAFSIKKLRFEVQGDENRKFLLDYELDICRRQRYKISDTLLHTIDKRLDEIEAVIQTAPVAKQYLQTLPEEKWQQHPDLTTLDAQAIQIIKERELDDMHISSDTVAVLLANLIGISPNSLDFLGDGAAKIAYRLPIDLGGQVIRFYPVGGPNSYLEGYRQQGDSGPQVTQRINNDRLMVRAIDIPGLPMEICEYAVPGDKILLAAEELVREDKKTLDNYKQFEREFLTVARSNPANGHAPRDFGVTFRFDDGIPRLYVVSFDISHPQYLGHPTFDSLVDACDSVTPIPLLVSTVAEWYPAIHDDLNIPR